jgi:ectoine hydroxylase-related dioxygenase (phytanoyl-CoA dioxygenase family)
MNRFDFPKFTLGEKLTQEQFDFFKKNGVILFREFISRETVATFVSEIDRLSKDWLEKNIEHVNGVPLKFGKDEKGNRMIQRFAFASQYSDMFSELLRDPRFQVLIDLLAPYEGRIGEDEKDGLVINYYKRTPNSKFSQMGWHTDAPRDIFLGQRIMPMLNVGIHLDSCPFEHGGLRVIPGTHKQNLLKMLFKKKYFVDHTPDPHEVGFNIEAGDLTVHDGRIWHRVQQSPFIGEKSTRRVMYIPIITGKYKPKDENSRTPLYHRFTNKVNV